MRVLGSPTSTFMGTMAAGVLVSAAKFVRPERVQAFAHDVHEVLVSEVAISDHRLLMGNPAGANAPSLGQQLNCKAVQLSTSATGLEGEVLTTSQWLAE